MRGMWAVFETSGVTVKERVCGMAKHPNFSAVLEARDANKSLSKMNSGQKNTYVTVGLHDNADAATIEIQSGLGHSQTYKFLNELVAAGFVKRRWDTQAKKYRYSWVVRIRSDVLNNARSKRRR